MAEREALCRVAEGGLLLGGRAVNWSCPESGLSSSITHTVADCIRGAAAIPGVDCVAVPRVTRAQQVELARSFAESTDTGGGGGSDSGSNLRILAKIQCANALFNIDAIIDAADGVVLCRRDLLRELSPAKLVRVTGMVATKCRAAGVPLLVASLFFDSMETVTKPTHAETADAYACLVTCVDAVLLDGPAIRGDNATAAVTAMVGLCFEVEAACETARYDSRSGDGGGGGCGSCSCDGCGGCGWPPAKWPIADSPESSAGVVAALAHSAITTAEQIGASLIITLTDSGE